MIKNMNELNKKFDRYGFKDTHGHDLLACVDFQELVKDAETLRKARAVLAEHANVKSHIANNLLKDIEDQKELYTIEVMKVCEAFVALADALGGEV